MTPRWLSNWRALNAKRATIAKSRAGRELALISAAKRSERAQLNAEAEHRLIITNALELRKQLGLPEWPGIGGK
jgi:hypothetical protein